MVSEHDRDALRSMMPELLRERCGVTDLRRSFRCPSPGHDDADPSAHYYEKGNTVHCFGCGKTWDVFTLIGELEGVEGFAEQAHAAAEALGYPLGDCGPREQPVRRRPAPRPPFDEPRAAGAADCGPACAAAFGELYAPGNEVGRRYLRYRGLDDDDAARFGLGFTRDPRKIMPEFRVWEPEALGFITIPFWSSDFSEARYCMVRTVSRGEVRNKEWRPKGVASPLWNEWMLSATLPVVYVTEGLIDAMALSKALRKPVMALGGVANAKRFSQVAYHTLADARPGLVVVCMDEDDEGRKAAARLGRDLDAIGIAHSSLPPYPGGAKDADEWLMAARGKLWTFGVRGPGGPGAGLYYTRWSDGR